MSILPPDKPIIRSILGPDIQIFGAIGARIYKYSPQSLKWSCNYPLGGALIFCHDPNIQSLYFHLVDLDRLSIIWSFELYYDFDILESMNGFLIFEGDHSWIGILFAHPDESCHFQRIIKSKIIKSSSSSSFSSSSIPNSNSNRKKGKNIFYSSKNEESIERSNSPNSSIETATSTSSSTSNGPLNIFDQLFRKKKKKEKEKKENSSSLFGFGSFSNSFNSNSNSSFIPIEDREDIKDDDIGDPTNFRHLAHVGFNSKTGTFDLQNIPSDWRAIFEKAGVTKEQLINPNTANFIASFVEKHSFSTPSPSSNSPSHSPSNNSFNAASSSSSNNNNNNSNNSVMASRKGPPPPPPAKSKALQVNSNNNSSLNANNANNSNLNANNSNNSNLNANNSNENNNFDNQNRISINASPSPPPLPNRPVANKNLVNSLSDNNNKDNNSRFNLMASIREAAGGSSILKKTNTPPPSGGNSLNVTNGDNGSNNNSSIGNNNLDSMAGLLAKALAERNKKSTIESLNSFRNDENSNIENDDEW